MRILLFVLLLGLATILVGGFALFQMVKSEVTDRTKPVTQWSPSKVAEDPEKFAGASKVEMESLSKQISATRADLRVEVTRSRSVLRFEEGFFKSATRRLTQIREILAEADRAGRSAVVFEGETWTRRDIILLASRLEIALEVSKKKKIAARRVLELAPAYEEDLEMLGRHADDVLVELSAVGNSVSISRIPAFSKTAFETIQTVRNLAAAAEGKAQPPVAPSYGEILFEQTEASAMEATK